MPRKYWWRLGLVQAGLAAAAWGGTLGRVVPIGGHASDLALDEARGVVYVANFTANRIDVISLRRPGAADLDERGRAALLRWRSRPTAATCW